MGVLGSTESVSDVSLREGYPKPQSLYTPTVSETHYIVTTPPTLILSNPNLHITGLSRDNRGWRFRVSNGSFECLLSPLNPSDVRGNISCGGERSSFSVFF